MWRTGLDDHPDREFARYVVEGLRVGFRIRFDYATPLRPAKRNMPSAAEHPEVIDQYIEGERAGDRILGPFVRGAIVGMQANRLGVVPKGHTPGKWRLITDLSFPEGASVNDGIDRGLCSLQYTSVENVARAAQALGRGALLAKLDIKSAYRLVPVHPDDRHLLGFEWRGRHYVDGMLPFGLRSAPKIFTAVADALEWVLRRRGVARIDHYLDDFIVIGPPGSPECAMALDTVLRGCADLGVPLAMDKLEGPVPCLTFLGIEIDTEAEVLRLPQVKFERMRATLELWSARKVCKRKELESLIGILQHACKVIRPGRSFLRRMIDLLRVSHRPHHHIRLNHQFRADLLWWRTFAAHWNWVTSLPAVMSPACEVTSDASGHWGCGAWSQRAWFQFEWPEVARPRHIAFKELFAVVLACATWGKLWRDTRVRCRCDNQAAVCALTSRSCRDPTLMHLLRGLFFIEAWFNFDLVAVHIAGVYNTLADDLSRNALPNFLSKAPQMDPAPTPIAPQLAHLLLQPGDWTSPAWTASFVTICTGD